MDAKLHRWYIEWIEVNQDCQEPIHDLPLVRLFKQSGIRVSHLGIMYTDMNFTGDPLYSYEAYLYGSTPSLDTS